MRELGYGLAFFAFVIVLAGGGFMLGSHSEKWKMDTYTQLSANWDRSAASTDRLIVTLNKFQELRCQ